MSDAKFDAAFAKGDKDGSGGIGKSIKRLTSMLVTDPGASLC